jgi:hypothetical protein
MPQDSLLFQILAMVQETSVTMAGRDRTGRADEGIGRFWCVLTCTDRLCDKASAELEMDIVSCTYEAISKHRLPAGGQLSDLDRNSGLCAIFRHRLQNGRGTSA